MTTAGSNDVGRTSARTINQTVALVFGALYILVAVIGFFVAETFASTDDDAILGIFEVNHLHNLVHLLIGLALIAASRRLDSARGANLAIGATYLLLGVLGWFIDDTSINLVALNQPDHLLHLASGALLTAVALGADKTAGSRV